MMDACGCNGLDSMFDRRTAERDRDRYRRKGADRTTRLLLGLIRPYRVEGSTVVLVDASPAYLEVARQEARQANLSERIEFVVGDFVRRAAEIDTADIVTLDRVVCCYPDAEALVGLSAIRAGRV